MLFEDENTEFKVKFTDEIYKEVIAFADTDGGVIYIGVSDDGTVIGIEDIDNTYIRLTNGIRDAIQPDVTMFIRYILQDNNVIRIEVGEGSYKPYYLKSKGLKPIGVYVRQGASSSPASSELIRQMIKESDGDQFENLRTMQQELTFSAAETAFERYGVEFGEEKFITLGLRNAHDDHYTNLALLLSNQCQHTIKVAVFADNTKTIFKDAKEFSGSIFQQLENAYSYLKLCNRTMATFEGLNRIEKQDYPEEALREALLNAIVHRDYSFSGSIIINVNDTEIEFISIGGLLSGLSVEDIRSGISQPRNPKLAEIFHRLNLIESYGTGIRRIYKLYENNTINPRIEVTPNAFKLVLPNTNNIPKSEVLTHFQEKPTPCITPQMKAVLDYLSEYGEIGDEELQDLLNVKRTRAYLVARQMMEQGFIKSSGRGVNKRYYIK